MVGKKVNERLGLIGSKDFKYQAFQNEMLLAVASLPGAAARRAAQAPCPNGRRYNAPPLLNLTSC